MFMYNHNKEGGIENGIKKYGKLEKVKKPIYRRKKANEN
jgi:hypothetical protein